MPSITKSGKQTAARQRAREKAVEFRQNQDRLEQLATDYFEVADSIHDVEAKCAKETAAARERTDKLIAVARAKSDVVIAKMLDLGTSRSEVTKRLGISTREVKKPATPPPSAKNTEPSLAHEAGDETSA